MYLHQLLLEQQSNYLQTPDYASSEYSYEVSAIYPDDLKLLFLGVLVGNKTDLEQRRIISPKEATDFAHSHGLEYYECSAVRIIHSCNLFSHINIPEIDFYKLNLLD